MEYNLKIDPPLSNHRGRPCRDVDVAFYAYLRRDGEEWCMVAEVSSNDSVMCERQLHYTGEWQRCFYRYMKI